MAPPRLTTVFSAILLASCAGTASRPAEQADAPVSYFEVPFYGGKGSAPAPLARRVPMPAAPTPKTRIAGDGRAIDFERTVEVLDAAAAGTASAIYPVVQKGAVQAPLPRVAGEAGHAAELTAPERMGRPLPASMIPPPILGGGMLSQSARSDEGASVINALEQVRDHAQADAGSLDSDRLQALEKRLVTIQESVRAVLDEVRTARAGAAPSVRVLATEIRKAGAVEVADSAPAGKPVQGFWLDDGDGGERIVAENASVPAVLPLPKGSVASGAGGQADNVAIRIPGRGACVAGRAINPERCSEWYGKITVAAAAGHAG